MSLLSYNELCALVEAGVISDVSPEQINGTSIDIRLGPKLLVESQTTLAVVDIAARTNFKSTEVDITDIPYSLAPGEFVLGHSVEKFYLPNNISAEFRLKSSGARSGLNNLFACHCDPGWNGSTLTLELHNVLRYHRSLLTNGMFIGQMLFHTVAPVPKDKDYATRGRYNKDSSVHAVKL
jgi:deoxycytidine triphosphate deaminase